MERLCACVCVGGKKGVSIVFHVEFSFMKNTRVKVDWVGIDWGD